MELPHLGAHCSNPTCKQLDYLPLKCDACGKIFCQEHVSYFNHECPSAYKKDVQVPVCPLCNIPIPVKRGEQPDSVVGAHIDSDCQSDPAKNRRKIFTNKCSAKGCRVKEVVPVTCGECKLNFCLKHRHPADHKCEGKAGAVRRRSAEAAMARQARLNASGGPSSSKQDKTSSQPQTRGRQVNNTFTGIQGSLSEDEALARAMALSMLEANQPNGSGDSMQEQVTNDMLLAQAIAESEKRQRSGNTTPSLQSKCTVS